MNTLALPLHLTSRKPFDKTMHELRDADNRIAFESYDVAKLEAVMTACNAHDRMVNTLTNMARYLKNCGYGDDHPWLIEIAAALPTASA